MSLLGECLLPYMFLVLIRELNASYLHEIMYNIHYFQLKNIPFCVVTITLTKISQITSNVKKEMCLQPPRIFCHIISSTLNELITYAAVIPSRDKAYNREIGKSNRNINNVDFVCIYTYTLERRYSTLISNCIVLSIRC